MKWKVKTLVFVLLAALVIQAPITSLAAKKARKSSTAVKMEKLEKKVEKYIKSSCPISANGQKASTAWSVYVKDLKTKKSFTINKKSFFAASTIKLYAMAAAYDKAKKGKLAMNSYIESLINSMITVSSNDAFNTLFHKYLGKGTVNKFCKANGYKKTQQYRPCGVGDESGPKGNNTSAEDCGMLLERIYRGKLVSRSASQKMLNYLKRQRIRTKIPRGVPYGIQVANKTGEDGTIQNDAAIVYGKKTTYIICVFSNTNNPDRAYNCIAEISRIVYDALN